MRKLRIPKHVRRRAFEICVIVAMAQLVLFAGTRFNRAYAVTTRTQGDKPNILVIWGDDIGQDNISAYSHGLMGYKTPNIDRIAKEGALFTDYYAEQN